MVNGSERNKQTIEQMSKLNEILALVRSMNADEFEGQLTHGESLEELHKELVFLDKKIQSRRERTHEIIEHISNCYAGDFFNRLPISEEEDELDVVCMGFNTYVEELESAMVSKKTLEKQNDKLLKEKKRSEQLAKAKDDFMSSMSHEIRTPLNGILGFTDLLLKNDSFDEESKKQLNYVRMLGDTLQVIINDILDLAKIESGKISLIEKPFNISILTQLMYDTFSIKTTEKNVDFKVSVDQRIPMELVGDSTRISQVLYNLVSNAVKFTPANGEILLEIVQEKIENDSRFVRINVKDTGIGIPADRLEHIFDPFIQVSNDTARQFGGTGLGLSIVKKIVSIMEGKISVESKLGEGTIFTVLLPLKEAKSDSTLEKSNIENNQNFNVVLEERKIKVLLAEDNRINQLLAQKVLTGFKFDCEIVENGKLAVEALKNQDFDVVLMDLMMPEMDGYEATIAIRNLEDEKKRNIPIIALTAVVIDSVTEKCASVGMNQYLSKPFKSNELYDKIMEVIKQKELA